MIDGDRERLTLEPIAPAPQVGLLLAALEDSRRRTLRELEPVTDEMLAWQPSEPLSSIGQLLYHVALIEADWLLSDILHLAEDEWPDWIGGEFPIDVRNDAGDLSRVPPEPVGRALARLARVRAHLLQALSPMRDDDLHVAGRQPDYDVSPAWALHHLLQHEAEHRAHVTLARDVFLTTAGGWRPSPAG